MLRLTSTLLLTVLAMMATPHTPRLELHQVELHEPRTALSPWQRFVEIHLTLINDGAQPVEVAAYPGIVPKITASDGKPVAFTDWRNQAGYAPPGLPNPPEAPVRTGQRRQLEVYTVMRGAKGYEISGPNGGAQLSPGRYRIEVAIDVAPTTREAWIAAHARAVLRPGPRPKKPQAEAERAAAQYDAHWQEVPSFFKGHLAAPPLDLVLP